MVNIMRYFLSVVLLALWSAQTLAAEVNLSVNNQDVKVGDRIEVTVDMSGFPLTHGGGINLGYNKDVLRAVGVQIDPTWNFVNRNGVINNEDGSISNILFSHFNGVEGDLPVAVIQMEVIGAGAANLTATESPQNPFAGADGALPVSFNNQLAAVNVEGETVVQEPEPTDNTVAQTATDTATNQETTTNQSTVAASTAETGTSMQAASRNTTSFAFVPPNNTASAAVSQDARRSQDGGVGNATASVQYDRNSVNYPNNNTSGSTASVSSSGHQVANVDSIDGADYSNSVASTAARTERDTGIDDRMQASPGSVNSSANDTEGMLTSSTGDSNLLLNAVGFIVIACVILFIMRRLVIR